MPFNKALEQFLRYFFQCFPKYAQKRTFTYSCSAFAELYFRGCRVNRDKYFKKGGLYV